MKDNIICDGAAKLILIGMILAFPLLLIAIDRESSKWFPWFLWIVILFMVILF